MKHWKFNTMALVTSYEGFLKSLGAHLVIAFTHRVPKGYSLKYRKFNVWLEPSELGLQLKLPPNKLRLKKPCI